MTMTSPNPFQKATRAQLKARVALEGPTGAGKTWTALEWATVLAAGGPIAVVDTERGSASLYSDRFGFDVVTFEPPYEPQRLVEIIKAAEANGYAVVVIDSLSHFWEGEGGTLDMVDAAASRSGGNQFAGWKVGTPALRHLVDTMLGLDAHLIATMRSKMEYVLSENERGKKVPQKVGMAPVMRAGVEYEFTLVGDLDLEHRLTITKSRCDLLADQVVQPGRAGEAAEQFMGWLGQGEPLASREAVAALVARMDAIGDELRRKACKRAFRDEIGMPVSLRESQLAAADALVSRFESGGGDDGPSSSEGSPTAAPSPDGSSGGGGAADPAPPAASTPGDTQSGEGDSPPSSPAAPVDIGPPQKGGGDDDSAGKGSSPVVATAAAVGDMGSSEAESEPPPATEQQGDGGALAPSSPSGTVPADAYAETDPKGFAGANRKARAIAKSALSDDKEIAKAQWEGLVWAISGGTQTESKLLTVSQHNELCTRLRELSAGTSELVETDDPKFLGWTVRSGVAA